MEDSFPVFQFCCVIVQQTADPAQEALAYLRNEIVHILGPLLELDQAFKAQIARCAGIQILDTHCDVIFR